MDALGARHFVDQVFHREYGAERVATFSRYLASRSGAVLGYRRAGDEALFLEAYLDEPIEDLVAPIYGRRVHRDAIIEIGNLASTNAMAMIELWGAAANDLGASGEIVVATLTRSLRAMFRRIGIVIHELSPAGEGKVAGLGSDWGSYYAQDPYVCAGEIEEGQTAISAFRARRARRSAA